MLFQFAVTQTMAVRVLSDEEDPPSKTRRLDGAASYRTKFKIDWKKEFDFITSIPGDPYR